MILAGDDPPAPVGTELNQLSPLRGLAIAQRDPEGDDPPAPVGTELNQLSPLRGLAIAQRDPVDVTPVTRVS